MSIAHRIRVWYVSLDLVDFIVVNVGKYTFRPMEPSWVVELFYPCKHV